MVARRHVPWTPPEGSRLVIETRVTGLLRVRTWEYGPTGDRYGMCVTSDEDELPGGLLTSVHFRKTYLAAARAHGRLYRAARRWLDNTPIPKEDPPCPAS